MRSVILVSSLLLASCAGGPPPEPEIVEVPYPVPVSVPCVDTENRPERVTTLKDRHPDAEWSTKPPGAKAQAVRAQAGRHMNYADEERAATSGCK